MDTDSVTKYPIKNTKCIICGNAFAKERASKLYCSSKCRQTGFYHKDKIAAIRCALTNGINNGILTFFVRDYKKYLELRKRLKHYAELENNFPKHEEGSDGWNWLYKNPRCALTFERENIPNKIFNLKPPALSLEQWSFIRSLYPKSNMVDFIVLVCALSSGFFNQLNYGQDKEVRGEKFKIQPIKTKYLLHCDKIVSGEAKFI